MKIDFSQTVPGRNGDPFTIPSETGQPIVLTLREAAYRALNASGESPPEHSESLRRGLLALKIDDATLPIDLKVEEVALVQRQLSLVWSPVVVARVFGMLEGKKDGDG